jgi:microcin C transport system permease protein
MDAPARGKAMKTASTSVVSSGRGGWLARKFRITPINKRRWANFKANRRGYWSLRIFLVILVVTLFAEFIANDRPVLVYYKGELLVPALVNYPEEKFGGFLAQTNYTDPVIKKEIEDHGWMIWPLIPHSPIRAIRDYPTRRAPDGQCLGFPAPPAWASNAAYCEKPSASYLAFGSRNWLGTDDGGRDVVARVIYGLRISILFALILTSLSTIIGVVSGAMQGYYGGWVDLIAQRFLEIWSSMPYLYVLIIIASALAPGFWTLLFVMLVFHWTALVGVVRVEFLRGRNFEYVTAARALGLSNMTIMFKHLLPNAMVATLTYVPFQLTAAISVLTALDFLGLGLPPPAPSLGELLKQGKDNLQAPWLGLSAFVATALLLSLLVFIGEAVRDALDPRKTFR